jgi:hypothetical protein
MICSIRQAECTAHTSCAACSVLSEHQRQRQLEAADELEVARLRRELDDGRSRLATITDEAFGPQEVLGLDALLTRLEGLIHLDRHESRKELAAAVDELGTLRLRCEDYRLDAVTAREELDGLKRRVMNELLRIEREHCSACGNGRRVDCRGREVAR